MKNELIVISNNNELIDAALLGVANKHTYRAYSRWLQRFLQYHEQREKLPISRTEIEGYLG